MARTYKDVVAQIAALEAEAKALHRKEVAEVIKKIRVAIDHYGLTSEDLGFKVPRGVRVARVATKAASGTQYGDEQGNTWGGRGPRPHWLRDALSQGRTLEEFVLGAAQAETPIAAAPAKTRTKAAAGSKVKDQGARATKAQKSSRVARGKRSTPPAEPQDQVEPAPESQAIPE